jgi:hypothetical protein
LRTKRRKFQKVNNDKTQYLEKKHEFVRTISRKLNAQSIVSLCAFYEIGHNTLYSEQYDERYDYYSQMDKNDLIFSYLADGYDHINDIEKGIKNCGQQQLL